MITHVAYRHVLARSLVVVALPVALLLSASDAGATTIAAAHAPGGVVHVAIAQVAAPQTTTVSRSVGLMTGASSTDMQAELGASRMASRSVGLK